MIRELARHAALAVEDNRARAMWAAFCGAFGVVGSFAYFIGPGLRRPR